MDSDYPFGILWSLSCLSFDLWILITPLVSLTFLKLSFDKVVEDKSDLIVISLRTTRNEILFKESDNLVYMGK